jgi:hypothetical protein
MRLPFLFAAAILFVAATASAGDSVYPAGTAISSNYMAQTVTLLGPDTLVVSRTLINSEAFDLTGLYLADHLPSSMTLHSYVLTLNGASVDHTFSDALPGELLAGFSGYYWSLGEGGSTLQMGSGDSLHLEARFVVEDPGEYALPHHSTVMYGQSTGYFVTDSAVTVVVAEDPDITPPSAITDLQAF